MSMVRQLAAIASPPTLKPASAEGATGQQPQVTIGNQQDVAAATNVQGNGGAELKDSGKEADKKDTGSKALDSFMNRTLKLEIDDDLGIVIAKIVDRESGEVLRQIPAEELVELAKQFSENGKAESGIFVSKEA